MTVPVEPVAASALSPVQMEPAGVQATPGGASFTRMMSEGVDQVNAQLLRADEMTRAFALGEDMPVHQVTFALEQARLSFELMNQVRTRLVESYQEILRMQV